MNTRDLICFKSVFEAESMNKAAQTLYMTSQGISRIIGNLEEELGAQLFERSSKGVYATESGIILYEHVNELLGKMEGIEMALQAAQRRENQLRIAFARGVPHALPFRHIAAFIEENPELEVTWEELPNDEVKSAVADFKVDIGLVVGGGFSEHEHLESDFLISRRVVVLVHEDHSLAGRRQISIDELCGERIISLNEQYQVYHEFYHACRVRGFEPMIAGKTGDSHFLYKLCRQNAGVGVLLDFSVEDFTMEHMKVIPLEEIISWEVCQIWNRQCREYSNVKRFRSFMEQLKKEVL